MQTDPNALAVDDDVTPAIEQPIPEIEKEPVIPTLDELNPPKTVEFNDAANGVDPDAPYGRNKDGTPAKKRGRKSGTTGDLFDRLDSVTESTQRRQTFQQSVKSTSIALDYRPIASFATGLWFGIPQMFFGDDWKPESADEPIIAKAFYDYFKAKGIAEVSPELGLVLALSSYTIVRVNKPTVKSRLSSWFAWAKSKARFRHG